MRRAYTPQAPVVVSHPRRLAIAPRAAIMAGTALVVLALVLAVRQVATAPAGALPPAPAASAAASPGPVATPAPGPGAERAEEPGGGRAPAAPTQVTVHVTGAVATPSVVTLPAGSRVADAVEAAGGATSQASTQTLNLARVLEDGEQVRVPTHEEAANQPQAGEPPPAGAGSPGGGGGQKVNLNTADATALQTLPGIGPALAGRIIDHRSQHGPFAAVEDITDVPGIGPAMLERLKDQVTV